MTDLIWKQHRLFSALPLAIVLVIGMVAPAQSKSPIPIDTTRQLFVDDFVVSASFGIERTLVSPAKSEMNPILAPTKSWEGGYVGPVKVLFDKTSKTFRMWYRGWTSIKPPVERHLCYATSVDGISWKRPNLGLVSFRGSTANNLIKSPPDMNFIVDDHDPDPSRRFKGVGRFDTEDLCAAFSPDGLTWVRYKKNPIVKKIGDAATLLGWDKKERAYVGFFRPFNHPDDPDLKRFPFGGVRKIARTTSPDFIKWSELKTVLAPDKHDLFGTQFYYMCPVQYEVLYFGAVNVLQIDQGGRDAVQPDAKGREQTTHVQLVVSRDGTNWSRLGSRRAWLAPGAEESWDDQQVYVQTILVSSDRIRVYYAGANVRHQVADLRKSGERTAGRWRGACVGVAELRRDGWVAVQSEPRTASAWLVTKPLQFQAAQLYANVDARDGAISVEVLDADQKPIAGFAKADSVPLTSSGISQNVRWKSAKLKSLQGKTVRLKFHIQGKARLYAFWCE